MRGPAGVGAKKRSRISGQKTYSGLPPKGASISPAPLPRILAPKGLARVGSSNCRVGSSSAPFPSPAAQPWGTLRKDRVSPIPSRQCPESLPRPTSPRLWRRPRLRGAGRQGAGRGRGPSPPAGSQWGGAGGSRRVAAPSWAGPRVPPPASARHPPPRLTSGGEGAESGGSAGERPGARRGGAGSPSPGAPRRAGTEGRWQRGQRRRAGGRAQAGGGARVGADRDPSRTRGRRPGIQAAKKR